MYYVIGAAFFFLIVKLAVIIPQKRFLKNEQGGTTRLVEGLNRKILQEILAASFFILASWFCFIYDSPTLLYVGVLIVGALSYHIVSLLLKKIKITALLYDVLQKTCVIVLFIFAARDGYWHYIAFGCVGCYIYHYILSPYLDFYFRIEKKTSPDFYKVFNVKILSDETQESAKTMNARAYAPFFNKGFILYTPMLKQKLSEAEFNSILAHEMGHIVKGHHVKFALLNGIVTFVYFIGFCKFLTQTFSSLSVEEASILTYLGFFTFDLMWIWGVNLIKHHFEFEADAYAMQVSSSELLKTSLLKIWGHNVTSLCGSKLFAFFYQTHPLPAKRLAQIARS